MRAYLRDSSELVDLDDTTYCGDEYDDEPPHPQKARSVVPGRQPEGPENRGRLWCRRRLL